LNRLEIPYEKKGAEHLLIFAPTFRSDLECEADIVEEIARIYGYHNIPAKTSSTIHFHSDLESPDEYINQIRQNFAGIGFCECYCNSLSGEKEQIEFWPDNHPPSPVKLLNSLSPELACLRLSLIPGLLKVAEWNSNRKIKDLQIFEIGACFIPEENKASPKEIQMIGGLIMGNRFPRGWQGECPHDFHSAKGLLETLLKRMGFSRLSYTNRTFKTSFLHENSIDIGAENTSLGFLGTLEINAGKKFDLRDSVFIFQIQLEPLIVQMKKAKFAAPLPKFPPVDRDYAFVFDAGLQSEKIREFVFTLSPLIEAVEWFDLYEGEKVGAHKKSMAMSLRLRSGEKTLTDSEVDKISNTIIASIKEKFKGELRK
jgi:phenylalanyl-tRNA synthetase beta chain